MFSPGPSGGKRVVLPKAIEQEMAHGILNLTRRIHQLQALHRSEERKEDDNDVDPEAGAGIITLAGHNCGATMNVATHSKDGHDTSPAEGHTTINIYINNNVQGVNNSILYKSSCTLRDPGVGLDFSNSETSSVSSEGAEGSSLGADAAVPDLGVKPSNSRYAGRKRSLSEILMESDAENEVAPYERSTRTEERSSSVNARIQGCSGERGDMVSDATGVEIVKAEEAPYERSTQTEERSSSVNAHIKGGSGENGAQASSKVESNRVEIVKAGEVCRRKPGRLRCFLRNFLCSNTDVIE